MKVGNARLLSGATIYAFFFKDCYLFPSSMRVGTVYQKSQNLRKRQDMKVWQFEFAWYACCTSQAINLKKDEGPDFQGNFGLHHNAWHHKLA